MPLSPDPLSPLQSQTVKRPSAAVERAVAVHADAEYAVSAVNADTAAESPPREELPPGAALSASIRGATARPSSPIWRPRTRSIALPNFTPISQLDGNPPSLNPGVLIPLIRLSQSRRELKSLLSRLSNLQHQQHHIRRHLHRPQLYLHYHLHRPHLHLHHHHHRPHLDVNPDFPIPPQPANISKLFIDRNSCFRAWKLNFNAVFTVILVCMIILLTIFFPGSNGSRVQPSPRTSVSDPDPYRLAGSG